MTLSPSQPQPQVKPKYSWAEIWTAVLTRPSIQTFQEILRDPGVSRRRAYTWMIIAWSINLIFVMILTTRDPSQFLATLPPGYDISAAEAESLLLTSTLCAIPLILIFVVAAFYMLVRLVQFVAGKLGGDVNYDSGIESHSKAKNSDAKGDVTTRITYSFAAIQAPLNIVSLLFAALPANAIVGIISLFATIYQFYLMSLAVRTIYGFSSGRAVTSIVITLILFLGLVFAVSFVMTYGLVLLSSML